MTRNRDYRPAPASEDSSIVSWIAVAGFTLILFVAFVLPVFRHLGGGQ
jgi:hypothetical protein